MLQAEIVDESDIYVDVERQVLRQRGQRADVAHYLAMFEHKLHQSIMLSSGEMQAVIAFLSQREEFAQLAQSPLAFQVGLCRPLLHVNVQLFCRTSSGVFLISYITQELTGPPFSI